MHLFNHHPMLAHRLLLQSDLSHHLLGLVLHIYIEAFFAIRNINNNSNLTSQIRPDQSCGCILRCLKTRSQLFPLDRGHFWGGYVTLRQCLFFLDDGGGGVWCEISRRKCCSCWRPCLTGEGCWERLHCARCSNFPCALGGHWLGLDLDSRRIRHE